MSIGTTIITASAGDQSAFCEVTVVAKDEENPSLPEEPTLVYFTSNLSADGLVRIYEALNRPAKGNVAVKISTGESALSNHLRPEFMKDLMKAVNGTFVECNTAYGGNRSNTAAHRRAIAERGFEDIAEVDIMDEEGDIQLPVIDTKWLKYNIVGSHLENYDFLINLAHFKGHAMGFNANWETEPLWMPSQSHILRPAGKNPVTEPVTESGRQYLPLLMRKEDDPKRVVLSDFRCGGRRFCCYWTDVGAVPATFDQPGF